jgi:hypothetical protein
MTPSGTEPATFRLVALCLNKLRHQQRAPIPAVLLIKYGRVRNYTAAMINGSYMFGLQSSHCQSVYIGRTKGNDIPTDSYKWLVEEISVLHKKHLGFYSIRFILYMLFCV